MGRAIVPKSQSWFQKHLNEREWVNRGINADNPATVGRQRPRSR